jgi:hypothetical protein
VTTVPRVAAALLAVALVATAACSGDDDDDDAAPAGTGGEATTAVTFDGPVAPLTGVPVDAAMAELLAVRPALAVKVDGTAAAEPRLGLDAADLVYEEPVEGATRLTAVFHSTEPGEVGPVRSARPLDDELVAPLGAALVVSGGLDPFLDPVRSVAPVWSADDGAAGFRRLDDRDAPHDLVVDTAAVWQELGDGTAPAATAIPHLAPGAPFTGTSSASQITLRYPGDVTVATWDWDAATGRWLATRDGRSQDSAPGERLGVAVVVVQFVDRSPQATGIVDANDVEVVDRVLVGSGHATVFAAGQLLVAEWSRTSPTDPTTLRTTDGVAIALPPGPIWWHLVPLDGALGFTA